MKYIAYIMIGTSLLFTACNNSQPTMPTPQKAPAQTSTIPFDPNNKIIVTLENGKKYSMPAYSSYLIVTKKNEGMFTHNPNVFKDCRVSYNSVLWRSPEFMAAIASTKTPMAGYLETAEARGVAGCAKALPN